MLLAEVHLLSCGRSHTLGRRTTSVNEQSEQAAGQDKYWSAGHLQPGWSQHWDTACLWHRACRDLWQHLRANSAASGQSVPGRSSMAPWEGQGRGEQSCSLGRQQWPPGHGGTGMWLSTVPAPFSSCLWALGTGRDCCQAGAALVCCRSLWVPGRLSVAGKCEGW